MEKSTVIRDAYKVDNKTVQQFSATFKDGDLSIAMPVINAPLYLEHRADAQAAQDNFLTLVAEEWGNENKEETENE